MVADKPFWILQLKYWLYTPEDHIIILPDHENMGIDIDFTLIGAKMTILLQYYVFEVMAAQKCDHFGFYCSNIGQK